MKKIPTIFLRDESRRYVVNEVNPGCEWVFEKGSVVRRKYDGTCVMFDGMLWWARCEVKPGKKVPNSFFSVDVDAITGKMFGWEPIGGSAFYKFFCEAFACHSESEEDDFEKGTYELIDPKVNGNPEKSKYHCLIRHDTAEVLEFPWTNYATMEIVMDELGKSGFEGVVFYHLDGRMAKLKVKDFCPREGS